MLNMYLHTLKNVNYVFTLCLPLPSFYAAGSCSLVAGLCAAGAACWPPACLLAPPAGLRPACWHPAKKKAGLRQLLSVMFAKEVIY